jgi:hypothetical protein
VIIEGHLPLNGASEVISDAFLMTVTPVLTIEKLKNNGLREAVVIVLLCLFLSTFFIQALTLYY